MLRQPSSRAAVAAASKSPSASSSPAGASRASRTFARLPVRAAPDQGGDEHAPCASAPSASASQASRSASARLLDRGAPVSAASSETADSPQSGNVAPMAGSRCGAPSCGSHVAAASRARGGAPLPRAAPAGVRRRAMASTASATRSVRINVRSAVSARGFCARALRASAAQTLALSVPAWRPAHAVAASSRVHAPLQPDRLDAAGRAEDRRDVGAGVAGVGARREHDQQREVAGAGARGGRASSARAVRPLGVVDEQRERRWRASARQSGRVRGVTGSRDGRVERRGGRVEQVPEGDVGNEAPSRGTGGAAGEPAGGAGARSRRRAARRALRGGRRSRPPRRCDRRWQQEDVLGR